MKPTPKSGDKFNMFTFIKEGARDISGTNHPLLTKASKVLSLRAVYLLPSLAPFHFRSWHYVSDIRVGNIPYLLVK
jgi:hypothetical protein